MIFVDSDWKEAEDIKNVIKKSPVFQSVDSFISDYEAYKKGKRYKLVYVDYRFQKTTEYVSENIFNIRLEAVSNYSTDTVGIVDLKFMFEVVCKVC